MSDDEEDYVSDDGEEYEEGDGEEKPLSPERKVSSDSFDFGEDEDEEDGEEPEGTDGDLMRKGSIDLTDDSTTVNSNNLNENSAHFTENTDDKSKFQQTCFETMRLLRLSTSKNITPAAARKALDMVYDNCKARFHAKERLGASGAAEYLCFLFGRWRSDTELMIRCAEVISEFVLNETENKILIGIQGIGRYIILALEEHRRHWPAIQALCSLIINLCNSKLPGMLQQNIMSIAKHHLEGDVNDTIPNTTNHDKHMDAKIFQQTRVEFPFDGHITEEQSLSGNSDIVATEHDITTAQTNNAAIINMQNNPPSTNNSNDGNNNDNIKNSNSGNNDNNVDLENDNADGLLHELSILDEDQWLINNRQQFGRAGMCHMITHILSLLCDYHNAHNPPINHAMNHSLSRPSSRSTSTPSEITPRHHLHRSALGLAVPNHNNTNMNPKNATTASENMSKSASLPLFPAPTASLSVSASHSYDDDQHPRPHHSSQIHSTPTPSLPVILDPHSNTNSRPISVNSDNRNIKGTGTAPSAAMAESLRLQLPPLVTQNGTNESGNQHHTHNSGTNSRTNSKTTTPKHHSNSVDGTGNSVNPNANGLLRPTSASSGRLSVRTPNAYHHNNATATHNGNNNNNSNPNSSHYHHHGSSHNPHQALQQVLYTNHDSSMDDLIIILMRTIAVLSDYEPNAKRFSKENIAVYITHLLKDKSATAATSAVVILSAVGTGSAHGNNTSNNGSSSPRLMAVNGPKYAAYFEKTNALLWAVILLCSDSTTGNKHLFGEAGATFLLVDRLHEIMRNVEVYRKTPEARRYVEYVSWALLNLVLDCHYNCQLVKQVTYADVVLDHLITMEVEVLVPVIDSNATANKYQHPNEKVNSNKANAKEALRLGMLKHNAKNSVPSTPLTVGAAGGGRKTMLGGVNSNNSTSNLHNGNNVQMVVQKELAMSAGIRVKLGRVKEIVYCVI